MSKRAFTSKVALILGTWALASSANAALFIVDTIAIDIGDLIPGDGRCEWTTGVPEGERCTLRAAVQESNALAGADVIFIPDGWRVVLAAGPMGDDNAAYGDLDILEDVGIGSLASPDLWPTVDGAGIDRVFDVHGAAKLSLAQIEVRGGASADGGALRVGPIAQSELQNCRLAENYSFRATAISNLGTTTVRHCEITHNVSDVSPPDFPAAVRNGPGGVLEVYHSTLAENPGPQDAFFNEAGALLTVRNSTIADNGRTGIRSEGDLVLRNVTITDHPDIGLFVNQPGAFSSPSIRNSILADNFQDCQILVPGGTADIGHPNLDSDNSCFFPPATGGLTADPELGALKVNGGTTRTRVPLPTSIARDNGDDASCETDDQRTAPRPLDSGNGGGCDLGAVEVLPCAIGFASIFFIDFILDFTAEVESCFEISVGQMLEILPPGDLTLRTRDQVTFLNDFSLHTGAELKVILDPAAGSGMTLP